MVQEHSQRQEKLSQTSHILQLLSLSFLYLYAASVELHKEHTEEPLLTFMRLQSFHTWT